MNKQPFSVFYQSPDGFFVCKTDFSELERAKEFLKTNVFSHDGAKFHFILKDGITLIQGEPIERTERFYIESIKYAIEIPLSEFKRNSS